MRVRTTSDSGQRQVVRVDLDGPPRVVSLGVGVHGTARPRDVFRLPDMWQLHVYRYTAELAVDSVLHTIRPGYVSLVPPGALVQYRYRGRSEHLYAHLRLPRGDGDVGDVGGGEEVPVVQDSGAEMPMLSTMLLQALAAWPRTPARAAAEV
ncbi:MAG: hypothetical protein ACRDUA_24680, partial [Micromonosporaceae bacterium]